MLNRQREDKIDQFIEVDKLIPIVEKHKFPLSRIREILSSRAFTPEWKIRELRDLFSVCSLCCETHSFLDVCFSPPFCRRTPVHYLGLRRYSPWHGSAVFADHCGYYGIREAWSKKDRIVCSIGRFWCSANHSLICGMPTELWVRWMMDKAELDGLIDPEDFVRVECLLHCTGKPIRRRDEGSCSHVQEAERSGVVDSLLLWTWSEAIHGNFDSSIPHWIQAGSSQGMFCSIWSISRKWSTASSRSWQLKMLKTESPLRTSSWKPLRSQEFLQSIVSCSKTLRWEWGEDLPPEWKSLRLPFLEATCRSLMGPAKWARTWGMMGRLWRIFRSSIRFHLASRSMFVTKNSPFRMLWVVCFRKRLTQNDSLSGNVISRSFFWGCENPWDRSDL